MKLKLVINDKAIEEAEERFNKAKDEYEKACYELIRAIRVSDLEADIVKE